MSSAWILMALASTAMAAAVSIIDSHFIARRMPGLRSYLLIIGIFTLFIAIALLIIFPVPQDGGWQPLTLAIVAAIVRTIAVVLMLSLMGKEEVTRIMPLGATAPVFVALLASIFLDERLTIIQWLAIGIVVAGAILISYKYDEYGKSHFHSRSFWIMLASSFLFAIGDVTNKYALGYITFWNSTSINLLISSILFILFGWRGTVVNQTLKLKRPWFIFTLVNLNQILAIFAMILNFRVIQEGPISLASTIFNTKPAFIFMFTLILGRLLPDFLLDKTSDHKGMMLKMGATGLIIGGVAIIFLA